LLVAATVVYARRRYHYWQGHARHMQKSGYLVPPASLTARLSHRLVTRALVYLGVGPIKVSGRRELMLPGRKIYVANHQFNLDFAVCSVAVRTCCPVMTKSAEHCSAPGAAPPSPSTSWKRAAGRRHSMPVFATCSAAATVNS
jgi:hypothetical protein